MDDRDVGSVQRNTVPRESADSSRSWLRERTVWGAVVAVGALAGLALGIWLTWVADRANKPEIVIEDVAADATIVVSVEGQVATPGVYELEPGSRIGNALDAAGGVLPDADLAAINRAARVQDGDRIIVPPKAAVAAATEGVDGTSQNQAAPTERALSVAAPNGVIDVNTASAAELEELPGIGPAKAAAIVEYRDANGPFRTVDDLALVPGISPEMVDDLRPLVRV